MKAKLIAGLLLAGSCLFAAPRFSVGVGIGAPVAGFGYAAPAPVYAAPAFVPPPAPARGYVWTPGYWFGEGRHRVWRQGFWATPQREHFERHDGDRFRR